MSTELNTGRTSRPCSDVTSDNKSLCNSADYDVDTDDQDILMDSSASPFFWDIDNNLSSSNHNNNNSAFVFSESLDDSNVSSYFIFDGTINNDNTTFDMNGSRTTMTLTSSSPLLSNEFKISLITLYTITTIFAILGNILVVIVFAHGRRCRTDIRPFLINLAVADLILAIFCMPFTFTFAMIRNWIFSAPMCPIVLFMQHLSVSASVFTNMAIGIDRFLVVTYPLKARLTTRRAKYTIAIIWLCSLSLSSVQLVVGRVKEYPKLMLTDCDERWSSTSQRMTFTISVLFITYIIPLVILSVTYSIVSVIMWKRTAPGNAHEGRDLKQLKAKRKVIKMLVLIVIMFALCWLPIHTFFLVLDFNPEIGSDPRESVRRQVTIIFYVVHWLAMSNSCANPIIYGFMNDSFRADLAALCYVFFPFCQCLKRVANRRFSMTTNFDKRFSTVRRSPVNSQYQQSPRRYGSKIYIELRRDVSKDGGSVKDFTSSEVPDRYARNSAAPFAPSRRPRRPQSNYLRQESEESSSQCQGLITPTSHQTQELQQTQHHSCDNSGNPLLMNNNSVTVCQSSKAGQDDCNNVLEKTNHSNGGVVISDSSGKSNSYVSSRPCFKPDFDSDNNVNAPHSPMSV